MSKVKETTDLLSPEDEKLLRFIQIVKSNISYLIGAENLVDKMREIINNSEHFSFRSKRNEKLISLSRPLFVLKFDRSQFDHTFEDENTDRVYMQRLIQKEITSVFSEFLSTQIRNKELLNKLMDKYGIEQKLSESDIMMLSFVTASIFSINIDFNTNLVYLEYVIH